MPKINKQLLQKYFNGNCSEPEKMWVEAWLSSDEHNEPLVMDKSSKEHLKTSIWENISKDMKDSETTRMIPFYKRFVK